MNDLGPRTKAAIERLKNTSREFAREYTYFLASVPRRGRTLQEYVWIMPDTITKEVYELTHSYDWTV